MRQYLTGHLGPWHLNESKWTTYGLSTSASSWNPSLLHSHMTQQDTRRDGAIKTWTLYLENRKNGSGIMVLPTFV